MTSNQELVSIGEAAEMMGLSISTLRRWDENGRFPAYRKSATGNRQYSKSAIEIFLSDLYSMAADWAFAKTQDEKESLPSKLYSKTSTVFNARLIKMQDALQQSSNPEIVKILSLVVAVAGEIGNNSFDHNIGNWPDVPGTFFGYSIANREVILADRGQGVLKTLRNAIPDLEDHTEALHLAFTEVITGRVRENRGNGLKFVRSVVTESLVGLIFQTGNARLELKRDDDKIIIRETDDFLSGCIVRITF